MRLRRPGRIRGFPHGGRYPYSPTARTFNRQVRPDQPTWFVVLIAQIRQPAPEEQFAVLAYCAMPDLFLVEGLSDTSCLARFVVRLQQWTGFLCRQKTGRPLWQSGYYDRVLRSGEATVETALYTLRNPIRAGLATAIGDYPYAGSEVFTVEEIAAAAMRDRSPLASRLSPTV